MGEHDDKGSRKDRKQRVEQAERDHGQERFQGEGDYQAARRFREDSEDFVSKADVEALAREARPNSAREARDLALAEERGRDRSKGDDAADPGIMYPGRKPDADH